MRIWSKEFIEQINEGIIFDGDKGKGKLEKGIMLGLRETWGKWKVMKNINVLKWGRCCWKAHDHHFLSLRGQRDWHGKVCGHDGVFYQFSQSPIIFNPTPLLLNLFMHHYSFSLQPIYLSTTTLSLSISLNNAIWKSPFYLCLCIQERESDRTNSMHMVVGLWSMFKEKWQISNLG